MIQIAVLGYGTVGSGVVEVIETNKTDINKKAAEDLSVKYILDLRDFPGDPYAHKVVHDYNVILNDPEVTVICETMGGTKPAYDFTKQALLQGKSVCTSNKELVSWNGSQMLSAVLLQLESLKLLELYRCGGSLRLLIPRTPETIILRQANWISLSMPNRRLARLRLKVLIPAATLKLASR